MSIRSDKIRKSRSLIVLLSACFCVLSCRVTVIPAHETCVPRAEVNQIATNIYVRPGQSAVVFERDNIANIGFIVGNRCVAVVDTGGSVAEGESLDCAIRHVTQLPVCYVITTHVHPDHLLGNVAFRRPGVQFIGHAKLARSLALRGDTYLDRASAYAGHAVPASSIVLPDVTVSDTLELDIGDRMLTLRAHASAHTDHDLTVVDNKANVAFVGDLLFLEHLPVIDGSINGWITELGAFRGESLALIVPGHGPIKASWADAVAPTHAYLTDLRGKVRIWIAKGGDLASAQDNIGLSGAADWQLADRYQKRNVGAAYAELEWED